jgi:predicted nucleic acid-binding protein
VILWNEAGELGALLVIKGATVKTLDLLIATYAMAHDCALLTRDADFRTMRRLGVPITLIESVA